MSVRPFLAAAVVLQSTAAVAVEARLPPGWTESTRKDDLIVFYKDNEQLHARDVLAYTEIDAPPEKVFKVVTDFESWPQFMPATKSVKILKRPTPLEMIVYEVVASPLISDRDFYIRVKLTHGTEANGGLFKSEWTCIPDYEPAREGVVRMRVNEGSWTYEPLDGGKRTRLIYSVLSNPAGSLPEWLVNRATLSVIPDLFKALRKRLGLKN